MTAKQHLLQIRKLNRRIYILSEEIEVRKARLTSITMPLGGEKVQTSVHGDRFADMIAALADKELQQESMLLIYQEMRDKIVEEILGIENELQQAVLYERYVNCCDWDQIARKLIFSKSHLYRIHGNALVAFTKKYQDKL